MLYSSGGRPPSWRSSVFSPSSLSISTAFNKPWRRCLLHMAYQNRIPSSRVQLRYPGASSLRELSSFSSNFIIRYAPNSSSLPSDSLIPHLPAIFTNPLLTTSYPISFYKPFLLVLPLCLVSCLEGFLFIILSLFSPSVISSQVHTFYLGSWPCGSFFSALSKSAVEMITTTASIVKVHSALRSWSP